MRDYVREMFDILAQDGDDAAYLLGVALIAEIDAEEAALNQQRGTIGEIGRWLQDFGHVSEGIIPKGNPGLNKVEVGQRPQVIMEAAIKRVSNHRVKVQDVFAELTKMGLDLDVKNPLAVIGTVLARSKVFVKIAQSTFEYIPSGELTW